MTPFGDNMGAFVERTAADGGRLPNSVATPTGRPRGGLVAFLTQHPV
jgi:hypothetical protein